MVSSSCCDKMPRKKKKRKCTYGKKIFILAYNLRVYSVTAGKTKLREVDGLVTLHLCQDERREHVRAQLIAYLCSVPHIELRKPCLWNCVIHA